MKNNRSLIMVIICFIILSIIKVIGVQHISIKILVPIIIVALVATFYGGISSKNSIGKQERKFVVILIIQVIIIGSLSAILFIFNEFYPNYFEEYRYIIASGLVVSFVMMLIDIIMWLNVKNNNSHNKR